MRVQTRLEIDRTSRPDLCVVAATAEPQILRLYDYDHFENHSLSSAPIASFTWTCLPRAPSRQPKVAKCATGAGPSRQLQPAEDAARLKREQALREVEAEQRQLDAEVADRQRQLDARKRALGLEPDSDVEPPSTAKRPRQIGPNVPGGSSA